MSSIKFILLILSFTFVVGEFSKASAQKNLRHRRVDHTKAYKPVSGRGNHINIKITPPEKRGMKGRFLVEVYNYSKTYISVMDFWLFINVKYGGQVSSHITVDDLKPKWGDLRWIKIPGSGKIQTTTSLPKIRNMQIFDRNGKQVKIKYYTDLIKE